MDATKDTSGQISTPNKPSASLASDLWHSLRQGAADELSYDQEHYADSAARAGLASIGGALASQPFESAYTSFKDAALLGAVISFGHFMFSPGHANDVAEKIEKQPEEVERCGYLAGRVLTDLAITSGISGASNRIKWSLDGPRITEGFLNGEVTTTYAAPYTGRFGRPNGNYFEERPAFRQERAQRLASILESRGEESKLPALMARLAEKPESANIIKARTPGSDDVLWAYRPLKGIPEFAPEQFLKKMKTGS